MTDAAKWQEQEAEDYLLQYRPDVRIELDKVITLDFETFWDKSEFTLSKLSMEEYVRDPRFMVHCAAIKQGDKPTKVVWGEDNIKALFDQMPWHLITLVAQNAAFEGLVLKEHYGVHPKHILCTQAMASMAFGNNLKSTSLKFLVQTFLPGQVKDGQVLLDTSGKRIISGADKENMIEYNKADVDQTWALFKLFLPLIDESPWNLDTIDMVTQMFTVPTLKLVPSVLSDLILLEGREKQEALDSCVAESMAQLRSNPKLATLLESLGVEVPMKLSPSNPNKETYAFAKDDRSFLRLLRHEDERVSKLVAARLRCKTSINETRAKKYLDVAARGTWPVHLYVSGANTTHRFSGGAGGGGNPQNLGKKSPLRRAIVPPPGYKLFAIDSSNIEMRGAMAIANERVVVEKLADQSTDMYKLFASEVYNQPDVDDVTEHQRNVGKVGMLSLQFGSGAAKFHHTAWTWGVNLTEEEAAKVVALYRRSFPNIPRTWDVCGRIMQMLARGEAEGTWFDHLARAVVDGPMGQPGIYMPSTGLYITYPNLRREFDADEGRMQYVYDTYQGHGRAKAKVATKLYGAKLFQHIVQAMCRNVVVTQSMAVDKFLRQEVDHRCRTVMHVHDESIHIVPENVDEDYVLENALRIYATSPPFWPDLPTFGEAAFGDSYATAKP